MTEGKTKIPYDRDATSSPICQLTTPTSKISLTTVEVSYIGRGSTISLATGREPILADIPNYLRIEGGLEEYTILAEP